MADFTYDLTTAVGKIRLEIGDETEGAGAKPDGGNFTDEELEYFYSQESSSVGRATARACEVLARQYARMCDISVGPRRESLSQAAKAFADRAKELRKQYGGGAGAAYSAGWIKKDAYGDSEPSDEGGSGDTDTTEYGTKTVYVKLS